MQLTYLGYCTELPTLHSCSGSMSMSYVIVHFHFHVYYILRKLTCTEGIRTQTELSSCLYAASFASLNDEIKNIFGYMKKRFCEDSFVLSPKCRQQVRSKSITPCDPSPSKDYSFGKQFQSKVSPLLSDSHPTITPKWSNSCTIH